MSSSSSDLSLKQPNQRISKPQIPTYNTGGPTQLKAGTDDNYNKFTTKTADP